MKYLILVFTVGFALVGCQGVKNEKKKNDTADDSANGSLEDRYQSALLSESAGGDEKEKESEEGEEKKPKKEGFNIGGLIMSLFDTDGDAMLTEKELNVMIKLTKNMLGKFIGGGMGHGKKMGHHHFGPDMDKVFDCMDGNKDGSLSKEEFVMSKKEMNKECFKGNHGDEDKPDIGEDVSGDEKEEEKEDEKQGEKEDVKEDVKEE